MKHLAAIIVLSACVLGAGRHHAGFSGTWKMNIAKSKNLPPSFRNLDSYSMKIEGSDDSMTVNVEFEGSGQKVSPPPAVYAFHGKERYREDTLRGSKRWTTSSWTTTGQKLIVTSRVIQTQGRERHYTETDVWEFRNRNTLEIHVTQKFEGSDSTNSERRIFRRAAN